MAGTEKNKKKKKPIGNVSNWLEISQGHSGREKKRNDNDDIGRRRKEEKGNKQTKLANI